MEINIEGLYEKDGKLYNLIHLSEKEYEDLELDDMMKWIWDRRRKQYKNNK